MLGAHVEILRSGDFLVIITDEDPINRAELEVLTSDQPELVADYNAAVKLVESVNKDELKKVVEKFQFEYYCGNDGRRPSFLEIGTFLCKHLTEEFLHSGDIKPTDANIWLLIQRAGQKYHYQG